MSLRLLVVAILLAVPRLAAAQMSSEEGNRFFVDKVEESGDEDKTLWQGSLIATLFANREAAGISAPQDGGAVGVENAQPLRYFTDLRAQVDANHISGKTWDARFDGRARLVNTLSTPANGGATESPLQSGMFSGNEFEIRDLFLVKGSVRTDTYVGRQTVYDIAAIKIDGLRIDYAKNRRWTYIGFAGLYPTRGSRSLTTDYPKRVDAAGNPTDKRVLPVAGGLGAAYRTQKSYGAVGIAGIVPLANDIQTGTMEQPRLFVTGNGYWRQSPKLDIFHYAVVDITGAAGFGVTNLSAGVNWRPQLRLHVEAAYHHVDTETLNVQAQTRLDPADQRDVGVVQNNIYVQRIATDMARTSVSAALGKTLRWEVTTAASARQRPEVTLSPVNDIGTDQIIPSARSAEVYFQVVDRRLYKGIRAAASFVRIFGFGDTNAARSTSSIVTMSASREFHDGQGEWEGALSYLASKDESRGACAVTDLNTCYGTSSVSTISASATGFYRIQRNWLLFGVLELANQNLKTLDGATMVSNPPVLTTTAFVRIAYRF